MTAVMERTVQRFRRQQAEPILGQNKAVAHLLGFLTWVIGLIFFFLVSVVAPLFGGAEAGEERVVARAESAGLIGTGCDEYRTITWTLFEDGTLQTRQFRTGEPLATKKLLGTSKPTAFKSTPDGSRWVHVGTYETYIALTQVTSEPPTRWTPYEGRPGMNHLAYEVDDVESLRERMQAAGYTDSTVPNSHPHRKRVYFYDPDGNDWEFIQYLTDDPALRHDYETPDR